VWILPYYGSSSNSNTSSKHPDLRMSTTTTATMGLGLVVVAGWFSTNSCNGVAMQSVRALQQPDDSFSQRLTLAVTITSLQLLLGALLGGGALRLLALVTPSTTTTTTNNTNNNNNKGGDMRPIAALHMIGSLTTNLSFLYGSASLVQIIKLLEPFETLFFVMAWQYYNTTHYSSSNNNGSKGAHGKAKPSSLGISPGVLASMALTVGAAMSMVKNRGVAAPSAAICFAILSGLAMSSRNVWQRQQLLTSSSSTVKASGYAALPSSSSVSSTTTASPSSSSSRLGPPLTQFQFLSWRSGCMLGALALLLQAACLAGLIESSVSIQTLLTHHWDVFLWHPLYNLFSMTALGLVSVLSHSILNACKRVVSILVAILWFQEPLGTSMIVKLLLVLIGGAWYVYERDLAKKKETQATCVPCLEAAPRRVSLGVSPNRNTRRMLHGLFIVSFVLVLPHFFTTATPATTTREVTVSRAKGGFHPPDTSSQYSILKSDLPKRVDNLPRAVPLHDPSLLDYQRHRHVCLEHIRKWHYDTLAPYAAVDASDVLYVDPAYHGNDGDYFLTLGSTFFLNHYAPSSNVTQCHVSQAMQMVPDCSEIIPATSGPAFYHPGGNWGDLYSLHRGRRDLFESILTYHPKLVGLPQSFWYDSDTKRDKDTEKFRKGAAAGILANTPGLSQDELEQEMKSRVVLSWREQYSYEQASRHYPFFTNVLVPDIAFQIGPYQPIRTPSEQVDILFLLRKDKEGIYSKYREREDMQALLDSQNINATFHIVDWRSKPLFFEGEKKLHLENSIKLLSLGKVVVCDRLHASILSYLSGLPFVYLDQSTQKINKTLSVAFQAWGGCSDGEASQFASASDMKDGIQKAVQFF
jgi:exopolysaccharide biosynthesis predicted pyruvyltransferase EpsI